MKEQKIYLNGRIVGEQKARVPVLDRGLNYGDGLFETIKAAEGRAEHLKEHLDRLKSGARALGFPSRSLTPLLSGIKGGAIERLLKANGLERSKEAVVKIIVTRGPSERGLLPPSPPAPSFIMTAGALDARRLARMRDKGVRAILTRGPVPSIAGIKTLNCLPGVLAKMAAKKAGVEEAIFTGPGGELSEATGANIFIVERRVVMTPPVNKDPFAPGVLPGVTREAVISLAGSMGINIMPHRLTGEDLRRCDEAFLTNSVWGVVPLVRVGSATVGDGKPGPVTRTLQRGLQLPPERP